MSVDERKYKRKPPPLPHVRVNSIARNMLITAVILFTAYFVSFAQVQP